MDNNLIKKISSNPALVAFCNRILSYNTIFEDGEARRLFLASLISADTLTDEESCMESLETVYFILDHMELFQISDEIRKEIKEFMEKTTDIVYRSLMDMIKRKNK